MKTVEYKGYQCSVEFDDGKLYVKVLHIDDLLVAVCNSASDVRKTAEELIDAYLEDCREFGREPQKPFKGSFNVRVEPEIHRGAAMAAAEIGVSLNAWVSLSIKEKLECARLQDRVNKVISTKREEVALYFLHYAQPGADWARKVEARQSSPSEMRFSHSSRLIAQKSRWHKFDA